MRVLVCGGRDFSDRATLRVELDRLRAELGITHVVTGAQRRFNRETKRWEGADYHAEEWARDQCIWYSGLAANWKAHGDGAGPRRNRMMLDQIKPERVIALRGGKGTANMCAEARAMGIEVIEIAP